MKRPRKKVYTLDTYLDRIKENDIRTDQDVQRLSGAWDKSTINELLITVLTDDYIPPVILGEEENSQLWIIDGLQRSTALLMFRYGNYRVTPSVEDPVIYYRAKARDKNGMLIKDSNGDIIWEDASFNIKNKTYDDLPPELKKAFGEYQVETVIHENCDMKRISTLVRKYNNHAPMKTAQKAFTYLDNFARVTRDILDSRFFKDCGVYTEKEKINGTLERVIMESVMCMFHLDNWKRQPRQAGKYLNENATKEQFHVLEGNIHRLENIIDDGLEDIFTSKNSYIWFALFNKFTESGLEDREFAKFLYAFKNKGLDTVQVGGTSFKEMDMAHRGTKDKSVVNGKLHILESLMDWYLCINTQNKIKQEDHKGNDITEVLRDIMEDCAGISGIDKEDVELFVMVANDVSETGLLPGHEKIPFIALTGYAMREDKEHLLKEWLSGYGEGQKPGGLDIKERFLKMKGDFDKFARKKEENIYREAG